MLIETATERKARLSSGGTVDEAIRNSPIEAEVVESTELEDLRIELDALGIEYSPLAKEKSLRKKLEEAEDK